MWVGVLVCIIMCVCVILCPCLYKYVCVCVFDFVGMICPCHALSTCQQLGPNVCTSPSNVIET